MDVMTVQYFGAASTRQDMPGASSTPLPGFAVRRISPGIRPRSQTERASGPCAPAPCTRRKTSTFAMMIATVITAGCSVGFSSLYGNMRQMYYRACLFGILARHDACPLRREPQHRKEDQHVRNDDRDGDNCRMLGGIFVSYHRRDHHCER